MVAFGLLIFHIFAFGFKWNILYSENTFEKYIADLKETIIRRLYIKNCLSNLFSMLKSLMSLHLALILKNLSLTIFSFSVYPTHKIMFLLLYFMHSAKRKY